MSDWPYVAAGFAITMLWVAAFVALLRGENAHAIGILVAMVGTAGFAARLWREDQ